MDAIASNKISELSDQTKKKIIKLRKAKQQKITVEGLFLNAGSKVP
jgi:hypothetical protein